MKAAGTNQGGQDDHGQPPEIDRVERTPDPAQRAATDDRSESGRRMREDGNQTVVASAG